MSGTLLLRRWHKVVQSGLTITQEDNGIGEMRPLQIPLDQAGMARVVFYDHESGCLVFWHAALLYLSYGLVETPIALGSGTDPTAPRPSSAQFAMGDMWPAGRLPRCMSHTLLICIPDAKDVNLWLHKHTGGVEHKHEMEEYRVDAGG
jgi:hypothetical protein